MIEVGGSDQTMTVEKIQVRNEAWMDSMKRRVEDRTNELAGFLKRRADRLEEIAEKVRGYATEIQTKANDERVTQEERTSWAVNEIENMIRSLDFAQAVTKAVALSQAKTALAAITERIKTENALIELKSELEKISDMPESVVGKLQSVIEQSSNGWKDVTK